MRRHRHGGGYRHPKTTAERKANSDVEYKRYVRGKRHASQLPDTYDDIPVASLGKSWKEKRKQQYRDDGRVNKHSIDFDLGDEERMWQLYDYCYKRDIPFRLDDHKESCEYTYELYKKIPYEYAQPYHVMVWDEKKKAQVRVDLERWVSRWKSVPTGEYRTATRTETVSYTFTWWHKKDIGADIIMSKAKCRRYFWHRG